MPLTRSTGRSASASGRLRLHDLRSRTLEERERNKKMTQTNFRRGLDPEFVEKLNELYDQSDSWWRALVDDDDLFLAVRYNYINVYYLGCSLLKLMWKKPTKMAIVGETHYKYLLKPSLTRDRITSKSSMVNPNRSN